MRRLATASKRASKLLGLRGVVARGMRDINDALFQALIARDFPANAGARGGPLREENELAMNEIDLVEERRPANHLEHPARGEKAVGLGSAKKEGASALARLDAPEVRPSRGGRHGLDLPFVLELLQVAADRARRHVQHVREVFEGETPGVALERLAKAIQATKLREFPCRSSQLRRARAKRQPRVYLIAGGGADTRAGGMEIRAGGMDPRGAMIDPRAGGGSELFGLGISAIVREWRARGSRSCTSPCTGRGTCGTRPSPR